jgi:TRAP-type C4-dicarboxylate transport system permease small subunit
MIRGAVGVLQAALVTVAKLVCVITGTIMVIMVFLGVFYRYVLGDSLEYATALPTVLFPYFIMSGAILAAAFRQHLSVDYVLLRTPEQVQPWILVATKLLVAVALILISLACLELLPTLARRVTPVLGWPASWTFYSLPVGFVGLAIYSITDLLMGLLGDETKGEDRR